MGFCGSSEGATFEAICSQVIMPRVICKWMDVWHTSSVRDMRDTSAE